MTFTHSCPQGHDFDYVASYAMPMAVCPDHGALSPRNFYSEFKSQTVISDDPFRKSYLSSRIDHNLADQGRGLDPLAPKDRFDLKRIEANTGRVYVGDSVAGFSPKARKAILDGPKPKGASKPQV